MDQDPKTFWNVRFSNEAFIYGERPSRLLIGWADHITETAESALVPASGEGRDAVYLAKLGLDVTAVDLSSAGLDKTQKLASKHGVSVTTIEANLLEWEWPQGEFDLIVSTFAHMPSSVRAKLHGLFVEALSSNGLMFIEGFTKDQKPFQEQYDSGGPPELDLLYSPDDIRSDFSALTPLSFFTGVETLFEGPKHQGPAALLRAVYQKTG